MTRFSLFLLAVPAWAAGCSGYATALPGQFQTLSTATIAAPLSRYPVAITVTAGALKTTANGGLSQSTGFDIAFSDDANTVCTSAQLANSPFGAHQIINYDGVAGTWAGFVELNGLSAYNSVNALLWIGKASVSNLSSTNVWPASYLQIYPLGENGSNASCAVNGTPSAGLFKDFTANARNSTGGKCPTVIAGAVGNAQSLASASSQFLQFVNGLTTGTVASISAWVKPGADTGSAIFYDNRQGGNGCAIYITTSTGANSNFCNALGGTSTGANLFNSGSWHHVAMTLSGGVVTGYLDGTSQGTVSGSFNGFGAGNSFVGHDFTGAAFYNGAIQHVRVSNALRSTVDIAAEAAMRIPATFFSLSNRVWGSTL